MSLFAKKLRWCEKQKREMLYRCATQLASVTGAEHSEGKLSAWVVGG